MQAVRRLGLRPLLASCLAVTAAITFAAATTSAAAPKPAHAKRTMRVHAYVTYYGWYDNTPPGCSLAYSRPCVHGTGTYKNPISFASDVREFPVGTIVYYPTVRKYFEMRDDCQECDQDWGGKGPDGGPRLHHIDLWIGGHGGQEADVLRCEDALTQSTASGSPRLTALTVNAPPGLPTSKQPLFSSQTNRCFGGARALTFYGRYENEKTRMCLEDADDGVISGSPAVAAPCSKATDEDLAFNGAYFTVNKLCLATEGKRFGSRLDFVTCSGRSRQLWEQADDNRISWVEYVECISDHGGKVQLAKCGFAKRKGADGWTYIPESG